MKKVLLAALVATATVGMSGVAMAMDDTSKDAMMTKSPSSMMATMVCRTAMSSEKPNAMMGATGLECKKMDTAKMMKKNMPSDPAMKEDYLKMFHEFVITGT